MLICAILLTRNDSSTIEDLILRCRSVIEPDVFIMDDGSTDNTLDLAICAGAMVLDAEDSRATVHQALQGVHNLGYTHAIVLRAGEAASDAPEQIPKFIHAAWEFPDGIYTASHEGSRPRRVSQVLASLSGWRRFDDLGVGFCLYPVEETLKLRCRESGRDFDTEALVRASWAGLPTTPIKTGQEWADTTAQHGLRPGFMLKLLFGMLIRVPRLLLQRLAFD